MLASLQLMSADTLVFHCILSEHMSVYGLFSNVNVCGAISELLSSIEEHY